MKRVIEGKAYNTATSTGLYKWEISRHFWHKAETLHRTRGGGFFLLIEQTNRFTGKALRDIQPISHDEAQFWIESGPTREGNFEKLTDYSRETVLYLRVPEALKTQLVTSAKRQGSSLNAWLVQCLESVAEREQPGGKAERSSE